MMKLGFNWSEVMAMPDGMMESYLDAYMQAKLTKGQKYKVKRKGNG